MGSVRPMRTLRGSVLALSLSQHEALLASVLLHLLRTAPVSWELSQFFRRLTARSSSSLSFSSFLVAALWNAAASLPWLLLSPEVSRTVDCPKLLFKRSHSSLWDSEDMRQFSSFEFFWRRVFTKLLFASSILFSSKKLSKEGELSLLIVAPNPCGPRAYCSGFSINGAAIVFVSRLRNDIRLWVAVSGPGEYSICMVAAFFRVDIGLRASTTSPDPSELRRTDAAGTGLAGTSNDGRSSVNRKGWLWRRRKRRLGVGWYWGELLRSFRGVFGRDPRNAGPPA